MVINDLNFPKKIMNNNLKITWALIWLEQTAPSTAQPHINVTKRLIECYSGDEVNLFRTVFIISIHIINVVNTYFGSREQNCSAAEVNALQLIRK